MVQERAPRVSAVGGLDLLERDDQLRTLGRLLADAADGSGSLAFISGEAGAGKTALVDAFLRATPAPRVLIPLGNRGRKS